MNSFRDPAKHGWSDPLLQKNHASNSGNMALTRGYNGPKTVEFRTIIDEWQKRNLINRVLCTGYLGIHNNYFPPLNIGLIL